MNDSSLLNSEENRNSAKENYMTVLASIIHGINYNDSDQPLLTGKGNLQNNFANPDSKAVMLILFLYSIEPDLYSELQEASRKCDKTKLKLYGAWAVAILQIFENDSEQNRLDRLKTGKEIGVNSRYGFFAGSVLLFRFGWLPMTQIDEWKDISQKESKWDKKICLPSVVSSFYTSLDCALEHSQHPDPNNKDLPVLFVVCM